MIVHMRKRVTDADFVERLGLEGETDDTGILRPPLQLNRADQIRSQLGVNEQDVAAAVSWARETK
jgi:hypothetical protein